MRSNSPFHIRTGVRIPELDGLRGLAIFLVLLDHLVYGGFWPETGMVYRVGHAILPLAWSGVDLFFVLSGFLIGGILMDQRSAKNYFKTFYLRRVCRILPLYFLWLALFILFGALSQHSRQQWTAPLFDGQGIPDWLYFVFLQNFHIAKTGLFGSGWLAATWSLAIEEQFYLFMPALIWFTPLRKLPYVLGTLIVFVPVFRVFLYLYHPQLFQYVLLPSRADSLLVGALCAYWIRRDGLRSWFEKHPGKLLQASIVLLAGVGYLAAKAATQSTRETVRSFDMVSWGYSWIALFYACLLLLVVTAKQHVITKIMRFSPLRYLGIISYCVYLIHMTVAGVVNHLILGKEAIVTGFACSMATLAAFLTILLLATLSWHFFEKPIIRWGHSFSYTRKTDPTTKAPIAL